MSDPLTELHHALRGQHVRAVVEDLDDTGPEQLLTLQAHYGQVRSQVPVWQPFGFASSVPLDGAITHLIQVGSDPSDVIALPPANPAAARMGGLTAGESCQYDSVGQKIYLQDGKIVRVDAHQELLVSIGGQTVLDVTPDGVAITGKLTVTETIVAQGDVKGAGISLSTHTHSGVQTGSGTTGKPQ
ncbi:phage baseplate assembly protein domain-containing protein [Gluconobacter frateurii]|uniref:Mu-like prophage protein gp45 n=1 Tax=Gluconobacter frateurii NRIC 0228 TaxID=1307946 RepID=A0ABQ0Q917_9PROT|nr:phage baseplate assembly protein [Gluconobacter frateurii]GBR09520.1 Mu-like prophage protein gp45 [Gluconobacter frateurii NRIC 0228]GLP91933.1 hypothetical protein GCM10007868_30080 [Gluconobacter frateurii]